MADKDQPRSTTLPQANQETSKRRAAKTNLPSLSQLRPSNKKQKHSDKDVFVNHDLDDLLISCHEEIQSLQGLRHYCPVAILVQQHSNHHLQLPQSLFDLQETRPALQKQLETAFPQDNHEYVTVVHNTILQDEAIKLGRLLRQGDVLWRVVGKHLACRDACFRLQEALDNTNNMPFGLVLLRQQQGP